MSLAPQKIAIPQSSLSMSDHSICEVIALNLGFDPSRIYQVSELMWHLEPSGIVRATLFREGNQVWLWDYPKAVPEMNWSVTASGSLQQKVIHHHLVVGSRDRPPAYPESKPGWSYGHYYGFASDSARNKFMDELGGKSYFDTHDGAGLFWCVWSNGCGGPQPRRLEQHNFLVLPWESFRQEGSLLGKDRP